MITEEELLTRLQMSAFNKLLYTEKGCNLQNMNKTNKGVGEDEHFLTGLRLGFFSKMVLS